MPGNLPRAGAEWTITRWPPLRPGSGAWILVVVLLVVVLNATVSHTTWVLWALGAAGLFVAAVRTYGRLRPQAPADRRFCAAYEGDLATLREPVLSGLAGTTTRTGSTALHFAAAHGGPEAVRLLVARGEDPNARSAYGWTPLHVVALSARGGTWTLEALLSAGAGPAALTFDDETALDVALSQWDVPAARLLSGGPVGQAPADRLRDAILEGDQERVAALCSAAVPISEHDAFGATPLHWAAATGSLAAAAALVRAGADPDARDRLVARFWGVYGHHGVTQTPVEAHITHGAVPRGANRWRPGRVQGALWRQDGWTPLHMAVWRDDAELVSLLLGSGANPRARGPLVYRLDDLARQARAHRVLRALRECRRRRARRRRDGALGNR